MIKIKKSSYDLDLLKSKIKKFDHKYFDGTRKYSYLHEGVMSEETKAIFQRIGAKYGATVKFIDGRISYYVLNGYTIEIGTGKTDSLESLLMRFAHELAHHIQYRYPCDEYRIWKTIRDAWEYERVAERLAYFICKEYFDHIFEGLHHSKFTAYLKKRDKKMLCEYYSHLPNDIM